MPNSPLSGELIAVGKIMRAAGMEGLCWVESFGGTLSEAQFPLNVLIGKDSDHYQPAVIIQFLHRPKGYVCHFEGVNDRDAAEKIQNLLIFIDAEVLPPLGNDSFYHFELRGMRVISDSSDKEIGIVEEVYNFPSADTLDVKKTDGSSVLIPLVDKAIERVDRERQCIIVRQDFLEELLS